MHNQSAICEKKERLWRCHVKPVKPVLPVPSLNCSFRVSRDRFFVKYCTSYFDLFDKILRYFSTRYLVTLNWHTIKCKIQRRQCEKNVRRDLFIVTHNLLCKTHGGCGLEFKPYVIYPSIKDDFLKYSMHRFLIITGGIGL